MPGQKKLFFSSSQNTKTKKRKINNVKNNILAHQSCHNERATLTETRNRDSWVTHSLKVNKPSTPNLYDIRHSDVDDMTIEGTSYSIAAE